MANSFTDLAADAYVAADVVSRERIGFTGAVKVNGGSERVAVGQTVRSAVTQEATAVNATPSMTIPEGTDQTVDNKDLTLTKQRAVQIPYTGEDVRFLNGGAGYRTVLGMQIQQAMRTLANEIDTDLWTEAYTNGSRAVGTAGTTPFGSNINVLASALRVLEDNGVPDMDGMIQGVFDPAAIENLRTLDKLRDVDTAGTDDLLRRGSMGTLYDIVMRQSKQIGTHTKGTGTSYQTAAALAVGDTTVTADTGSGTLLAGDIITFADDSNNGYVANSALSGGSFTIGDPGAQAAIGDNNGITIGNSYTPNCVFHRDAIELAMRAPAMPEGGDVADEIEVIVDPVSGLTFQLAMYKGYRKAMIEVSATWGYKAWMPKFICNVMG